MSAAAIRKALDAAVRAMNPDGFRAYPVARRQEVAAAVAAFHRSLGRQGLDMLWPEGIANAVEAAAREDG